MGPGRGPYAFSCLSHVDACQAVPIVIAVVITAVSSATPSWQEQPSRAATSPLRSFASEEGVVYTAFLATACSQGGVCPWLAECRYSVCSALNAR